MTTLPSPARLALDTGLYLALFAALLLGMARFWEPGLLHEANFLRYDAWHYYGIAFDRYAGLNVAFFPLFPLLWKLAGPDSHLISLLNVALFAAGFTTLAWHFGWARREVWLFLTVPGFIFFGLPYSEATFFAAGTLVLLGLRKDRLYWVVAGLFLCTLARPAFTILLPALVCMEAVCAPALRPALRRMAWYGLAALAGLAVVALIQYRDTGEWFRFFAVQSHWDNQLRLPRLPLTSWGGDRIVRLDAMALLTGLVSGAMLLWQWRRRGSEPAVTADRPLVFSLAYLAGISLLVVCFRGGSLFSLNRFVFATPFLLVAAQAYLAWKTEWTPRQIALALLAVTLFWLCFGMYVHIKAVLLYLGLTVYAGLTLALKSDRPGLRRLAWILLPAINLYFQIVFYVHFLHNGWVG
jgi:hypothetical protein